MELIDIGACLIENTIGFVFSWFLLSRKSRNVLPLIAVIITGTAVKFLFYRASALAGYLLTAVILFVGNMILSNEKTSKNVAVSMTGTYIICISDFIFGSLIALISMKSFTLLRTEWLLIKALSAVAFVPVFLFLRKIPKNSPNKFYSFFREQCRDFALLQPL